MTFEQLATVAKDALTLPPAGEDEAARAAEQRLSAQLERLRSLRQRADEAADRVHRFYKLVKEASHQDMSAAVEVMHGLGVAIMDTFPLPGEGEEPDAFLEVAETLHQRGITLNVGPEAAQRAYDAAVELYRTPIEHWASLHEQLPAIFKGFKAFTDSVDKVIRDKQSTLEDMRGASDARQSESAMPEGLAMLHRSAQGLGDGCRRASSILRRISMEASSEAESIKKLVLSAREQLPEGLTGATGASSSSAAAF